MCCMFFFFNDTATTEIYTLSLHDASRSRRSGSSAGKPPGGCSSAAFSRPRRRRSGGRNPRRRGEFPPPVRVVKLAPIAVAVALGFAPAAYANPQHAGIQVALRAHGLYLGPIDARVGPMTVAAIR